jgi:hypothetical protein
MRESATGGSSINWLLTPVSRTRARRPIRAKADADLERFSGPPRPLGWVPGVPFPLPDAPAWVYGRDAAGLERRVQEIAARLMELSTNAQENGEEYARITAENASAATQQHRGR